MREAISAAMGSIGASDKDVLDLDYEQLAHFHDAALEAISNDAPEVCSFEAEQDKGAYSVIVRGVPGAYFVEAAEHDNEGLFSTKKQAWNWALLNYGEFRVRRK